MFKDRKMYLIILLSLIFTSLAIIDGTSPLIALATIMFPFVAGYKLITTFKIFPGAVFATILWALSILVTNLLTNSLTPEIMKMVGLKFLKAMLFVGVYLVFAKWHDNSKGIA